MFRRADPPVREEEEEKWEGRGRRGMAWCEEKGKAEVLMTWQVEDSLSDEYGEVVRRCCRAAANEMKQGAGGRQLGKSGRGRGCEMGEKEEAEDEEEEEEEEDLDCCESIVRLYHGVGE